MGESARLTVKDGTESRQRARIGVVIPYFQREAGLTEPTQVSGSAGIGTWRNSTWGTPANLIRLADELRLFRRLVGSPPRSDPTCAASWCVALPKLLFTKASGRPFMVD
jgi:hypothetical protein